MLAADPQKQFEELKSKLLDQISSMFPIAPARSRYEVHVEDVRVDDELGVDDVKAQAEARLKGRSWAVPVRGTVKVIDKTTGKPVLTKTDAQIARLPKMTRHYTFIVGGQEKSITNQWRLRPGPYVKETQKEGEYEAQFQLAKGKPFNVQTDETGYLHMKVGGRKVPLYSMLHAHGVDDDAMRKAWGDEIFKVSKSKANPDKDLRSFHKAWTGRELAKSKDPAAAVQGLLSDTKMDPVVAEVTVGAKKDRVDEDVLLRASRKLLDVAAGKTEPDPIDSLRFKELWTAADHLQDRLAKTESTIKRRLTSSLGKKKINERLARGDETVFRDVFMPDLLQRPLYHTFTTSLANNGSQVNPLSMLGDKSLATITGPGGITNAHQITHSNTSLDPSHLGFLDPVYTPESNPGVNTHLTAGATVKNRKPHIRLYNRRTNKYEDVDAAKAAASNVALPDQVKWKGGKPAPVGRAVRVSDRRGKMRDDVPWSDVDYVIPNSAQVFAVETNLVPFLQNDSAGRSTMSARHMAQSISVVGREEPAVQVEAGGGKTFEELIGSGFLSHRAPADGKVVAINEKREDGYTEVVIQGQRGKKHRTYLYNHYPTNHAKGMLHADPTVRVGDTVKKGQRLADNNHTKDGKLALGTNLRVAYLASGTNHEDGITISRSAAEKLSSEHLNKPSMLVGEGTTIDRKAFLREKQTLFKKEQIDKIGDDGVIRVGQRVKPHDPLVLALRKDDRQTSIDEHTSRRIGKRMRTPFRDASLVWDHDYEGEVVRVNRNGKNLEVHVKTFEPAQVGSKLSTRHSAKGIVAEIREDDEMPVDDKGRPVQMMINPTCYDEQTEFLTQRGWVYGPDLRPDDVFATMDPGTFYVEWQRASRIVDEPYRGKMYRVKNRGVDLLVTPNHRMLSAPRVSGEDGTLGRLDFDQVNPRHFTDHTAEDIFGEARRYLKAGRWEGSEPEAVVIPGGSRAANGKGPAPAPEKRVSPLVWAEFMGWYLAEGHVSHSTSSGSYRVHIAASTKRGGENRPKVRAVLAEMGFTPTETDAGFVIYHKGLYEKLAPLGKVGDKYIPREVLDLPPTHLHRFLDAFVAGDGNVRHRPEEGHHGTRRVSSNSKCLIDGLQEICIKLGYAANVKTDARSDRYRTGAHYTMSFGPRCRAPWVNWSEDTKVAQVETWVDYDGRVYCCTVPNQFVVVRRNGVPVVSGNSVPGRMNGGQILETAAGKIQEKTGKPYVVKNFDGNTDYLKKVKADLKKHGLKETETLYDPKTGRKIGEVTVGPHYTFQLEHQIDKKSHVRSGGYSPPGSEAPKLKYDANTKIPRGGGHHGAQSLGALGIYGALAAGMRNNLHEMQTLKGDSEQALEAWGALSSGDVLPAPKTPFVYKKFENMLKAVGVDVEKNGSEIRLIPRSDEETRKMSRGEIKDPTKSIKVRSKDDAPEKDGLFDRDVTGGPGGKHWGHIELAEPMPNPVHAKSIALTLGLDTRSPDNSILKILQEKDKGPKFLHEQLKKIDVDKELAKVRKELDDPRTKGSALNKANFKYKALRNLKRSGKSPAEAWTMKALPVVPPVFRPQGTLPDGTFKNNPLNRLYRKIGMVNQSLKKGDGKVPYNATLDTRAGLYQEMANLFGTTPKSKKGLDLNVRGTREDPSKELPGIIHMLAGEQPKDGFFQDKMIGKKQDYTARATIVADPTLSADEVGVPKKIALELYRPMIVKRLTMGARDPQAAIEAHRKISRKDPVAIRALEKEIEDRPALLKRDPVLHQYGLVGQKVKLVDSPAIKVSPLVLPPVGGDVDGDCIVGDLVFRVKNPPDELLTSDWTPEILRNHGVHAPDMEGLCEMFRHSSQVMVSGRGGWVSTDIANFPRVGEPRVNDRGVEFYAVPEWIEVMALGPDPEERVTAYPVTEFSIHHDLRMLRVTTHTGRRVECSEDHSLYCMDPETLELRKSRPEDSWGRMTPRPKRFEMPNRLTRIDLVDWVPARTRGEARLVGADGSGYLDLDQGAGWALGMLIGDGWTDMAGGRHKNVCCGKGHHEPIRKRLTAELRRYVPDLHEGQSQTGYGKKRGSGNIKLQYSCMELAHLISDFIGKGAKDKHLPPFWSQATEEFRLGLLAGLLDSDGSLTHDKNGRFAVIYTTASEKLADQVCMLTTSLGIRTNRGHYSKKRKKAGKTIVDGPYFHITLWTRDLQTQASRLDLAMPKKAEVLKALEEKVFKHTATTAKQDLVPISIGLLHHLSGQGPAALGSTLYSGLRRTLNDGLTYISRYYANKLINLDRAYVKRHEHGERWIRLVENEDVIWDRIEEVEPLPGTETAYDLTVPGPYTFMTADQLVVWDTVAMFAPLSREAVEETKRIMPSQRTLSDSSGDVLFKPANESSLALYRMSLPRGNKRALHYPSRQAAEKAFQEGKIALNDVVRIAGKETTLGRYRIAQVVPEKYRTKVLTDLRTPFTKKLQGQILKETAVKDPKRFLEVADRMSQLGFQMAYESGHTVTLSDLEPLRKERDQIVRAAQKRVDRLRAEGKDDEAEKEWLAATRKLHDTYSAHYEKNPTNVSDMRKAGIKAKREQFQGLLMAPMLVQDHRGKPAPAPVTRSFAEGVDLGGYFMQASGARRGVIQKVDSVREPGYMSKLMVQANIDQPITGKDCGVETGVAMPVTEKDVVDRFLAAPLKVGGRTFPRGSAVTPELLAKARQAGVRKITVRSPLKCRMPQGVCSRCMGAHPSGQEYQIGENVGVISAQALGERAAQIMLKQTHGGGIVSTEGSEVDAFSTVQRLFDASKRGATDARVSPSDGVIQRVHQQRGVYYIYFQGRKQPIRTRNKPLPGIRPGARVRKGQQLTQGEANIHDILKTQGLEATQNVMAKRIGDIYAKEGVLRRHAELTVRNATGIVEVTDPGDHDSIVRGDTIMKPVIDELNRTTLRGRRPIRYRPTLVPTKMNPLYRQKDFVARLQGERIGQHLTTAMQHGQRSNLRGIHPIPSLAAGEALYDPRRRR